jgi:hypothetical protein
MQRVRQSLADCVQIGNPAIDLEDLVAHTLLERVRGRGLTRREP